MAPTYLTAVAMLIAGFFAAHGTNISADNIGITIVTLFQIGGSLFVMGRQLWTGRSTLFGTRP